MKESSKKKNLKGKCMTGIMILFAFTLSLVINFIERIIYPSDNNRDTERKETHGNFAVEESE